ncbi:hypothetical protein D4R08_06530 [Corynebacterium xerosis]|nr:hypothetical protein D4R08_06530 [Corynebacterium xerosis]
MLILGYWVMRGRCPGAKVMWGTAANAADSDLATGNALEQRKTAYGVPLAEGVTVHPFVSTALMGKSFVVHGFN